MTTAVLLLGLTRAFAALIVLLAMWTEVSSRFRDSFCLTLLRASLFVFGVTVFHVSEHLASRTLEVFWMIGTMLVACAWLRWIYHRNSL